MTSQAAPVTLAATSTVVTQPTLPLICPKGTALNDGCSTEHLGSVAHPTFFAGYAAQSGQTFTSRPPWNVAGVDYPVGAMLGTVWLDPATAALPSGCSYSATGSLTHSPLVSCKGSVSPTLANFDFSGTLVGTHGAVLLTFDGMVSGTVTLTNDTFGLDAASALGEESIISFARPGAAALVITNVTIDGHGDTLTGAGNMNAIGAVSTSFTATYNAFINIPGRIESGYVTGDILFSNNYVDGFIFPSANGTHGEILYNVAEGVVDHVQYSYNTVLEPTTVNPDGGESPFYISNGGVGAVTFNHVQIDHNVEVANLAGGVGGVIIMAKALASFAYGVFPDVSISSNYVDKTGSYFDAWCGGSAAYPAVFSNPPVFSDNIDLVSGAAITSITAGSNCTI